MTPERQRELYSISAVKDLAKVPSTAHWVVLIQKHDSFHIPGDERSRTHPGHGYPEHTETVEYFEYYPFETKELAAEYVEYRVNAQYTPVRADKIRVLQVSGVSTPRMKAMVEL